MTKTVILKTAIVAGLIIAGLGAGAYSTFAAEEGGRQGHRKHPPMHGEIVAIDDSSVTISLVFGDRPVREENEGERVKENKFEEGIKKVENYIKLLQENLEKPK